MADLFSTLRRSGGIDALARHAGITPTDAAVATRDLLPEVIARFGAHFGQGGVAGLTALLDRLGDGDLAFALHRGGAITAERRQRVIAVLPGADRVAALLAEVRRRSVVPAEMLAAILPLLVILVGGYLAARIETAPVSAGQELRDIFGLAAGQG
ncbi:MAG: hypothetical protein KGN34_01655 [Sphingomonadales bacterium]|nr:hypothetical protein [Sphingomonadales bacterium]